MLMYSTLDAGTRVETSLRLLQVRAHQHAYRMVLTDVYTRTHCALAVHKEGKRERKMRTAKENICITHHVSKLLL